MILQNNTVLVVGANGRIGSVISKRLLEEGANVIAADITLQNLKNNEFGVYKDQFLKIEMDITNKESIEKAFEFYFIQFGKIDSAINTSYPKGMSMENISLMFLMILLLKIYLFI